MRIDDIILLLIIYQLKHFIADFPLQTHYMLGKFRADWGFLKPLAAHAGVQALFTFFIAWCWYWYATKMPLWAVLALPAFDFCVHFTMDRIKAGPKYLGRFKPLTAEQYMDCSIKASGIDEDGIPWVGHDMECAQKLLKSNTYFWWSLGFDQMVHHLTHYVIIYFLVTWR